MKSFIKNIIARVGVGTVQPPPEAITLSEGESIIRRGFNVAIIFSGVLAVAFIIWGGYRYIMSQGEPQKIKEAQQQLTYAVAGLAIVLSAFIIAEFIATILGAESIFNQNPFNP